MFFSLGSLQALKWAQGFELGVSRLWDKEVPGKSFRIEVWGLGFRGLGV